MKANIIDFKSATTRNRVSSARTEYAEPSTETLSPTLKNSRLRKKRKDAWWEADAVTGYWLARLNLNSAIERVQRWEAPEGRDHPAGKSLRILGDRPRRSAAKSAEIMVGKSIGPPMLRSARGGRPRVRSHVCWRRTGPCGWWWQGNWTNIGPPNRYQVGSSSNMSTTGR
jgi:hypothetical protein